MRRSVGWIPFLFLVLYLSSAATAVESTTTWISGLESGYALELSYSQCAASTGNTSFTAAVTGTRFGGTIVDANVFATIERPDSTTFDVNFTNNLSGTYTSTINLTQSGTYFIQARAYQPGVTPGDFNGYVYVGDLNWTTAFLSNGFDINIGELGTIRNTVTNSDGNRVYDINANTTIYYPNGTAADANSSMTQIANGEFIKAFFGPTPAGEYTVSSFFSCGPLLTHNAGGTFTVLPASSSSGSGDTGSSGSSGSGSSGGSGGGGSGGGTVGVRARILEMTFDPAPVKESPSALHATILNLGGGFFDYRLVYQITAPDASVYEGIKEIHDVAPQSTTTVIVDPSYIPLETGDYLLNAALYPLSGVAVYDTYSLPFSVEGTHQLVLTVQPASLQTALGLTFPFTVHLLNNGNFAEENIQLDWYLEDPEGNEYAHSNFSTRLGVGEAGDYSYSPFIPIDTTVGLHTLRVDVRPNGVTQTKTIAFNVQSPNEYYAQLLTDLELRANQIGDKIQSLEQRGFDVGEAALTLLDIRSDLANAKGMLLAGKFETLNTKLLDLSTRITRLAAMIDALEQQSPLLSREGLTMILYIGAALLLGLFIWFLFWLRQREKEEKKTLQTRDLRTIWAPGFLPRWLFTQKCYYSPSERQKLKPKPLISRILGLVEKEEN